MLSSSLLVANYGSCIYHREDGVTLRMIPTAIYRIIILYRPSGLTDESSMPTRPSSKP